MSIQIQEYILNHYETVYIDTNHNAIINSIIINEIPECLIYGELVVGPNNTILKFDKTIEGKNLLSEIMDEPFYLYRCVGLRVGFKFTYDTTKKNEKILNQSRYRFSNCYDVECGLECRNNPDYHWRDTYKILTPIINIKTENVPIPKNRNEIYTVPFLQDAFCVDDLDFYKENNKVVYKNDKIYIKNMLRYDGFCAGPVYHQPYKELYYRDKY